MTTQEIAKNLVAWCRQGEYDKCYSELYSTDVISIEPDGENPVSNGMEEVLKKSEWWAENFEYHGGDVSDPIIADNWFTVRFDMDTTFRPTGQRSQRSELAVYQVQDGKIVKEQFFYDPMPES